MIPQYVLASSNSGKINEIKALLSHLAINFIPQTQLNIPDIEETGTTFFENAILKARHAARLSGLPAIADDSGLAIDVLNGAPGVYSSRYAGSQANDNQRITKVLQALNQIQASNAIAHFHCVIALMRHSDDPAPLLCHGQWTGVITDTPAGHQGFGFDPIFFLPDYQCTAAELDFTIKNRISHRGRAIAKLIKAMEDGTFTA